MFVIDLLKKVNLFELAKLAAENDWELNNDNTIPDKGKEEIRAQETEILFNRYKDIINIKPDYDDSKIIVVFKQYEYVEDEYYHSASLYEIEELKNKSLNECSFYDEREDLTQEEYSNKYIQSYAFELTDWKDVLGYLVSEESVKEYGAQNVAYAIIDEMTFFGSEYDLNNQRREQVIYELSKSLEEIKSGEYKSKTISLEELEKDLDLPKETDEEKEINNKKMLDEMEYNRIEQNRILKQIIENLRG